MSGCPYANLLDPDTYAQGMPYQKLKEIRDAGPVVKQDDPITGIPYWTITRQIELDEVSKNPKLYSSAERSPFPMEFDDWLITDVHRKTIIGMDPPEHQVVRRIMRNAFTPKNVDSYEPKLREHARRIVDAVVKRGECEFVEEVAAELPLITILELLGVPLEDRKKFFDWTNTMIFADDPDMAIDEDAGNIASSPTPWTWLQGTGRTPMTACSEPCSKARSRAAASARKNSAGCSSSSWWAAMNPPVPSLPRACAC
jgi:cytochrome P450